jgi:hypothetical protein
MLAHWKDFYAQVSRGRRGFEDRHSCRLRREYWRARLWRLASFLWWNNEARSSSFRRVWMRWLWGVQMVMDLELLLWMIRDAASSYCFCLINHLTPTILISNLTLDTSLADLTFSFSNIPPYKSTTLFPISLKFSSTLVLLLFGVGIKYPNTKSTSCLS